MVNSNKIGSSFLNGESDKLKEWIILMEKKEELRLTYSKNSREFIMQNYSEEIISKKYYDLINSVINIE